MEAETLFWEIKGQWFYILLLTEIGVEPFKPVDLARFYPDHSVEEILL